MPLLQKGPVGLIFQSGGSLGNWVKGASERGIGFTYAVSSGNEVSLDLVDYLSFLVDEPDTKVITLMVEGIRRPQEFMTVAEEALKRISQFSWSSWAVLKWANARQFLTPARWRERMKFSMPFVIDLD